MRKLIAEEWLSLDGYVADREGNLDFLTSPELNRQSDIDQVKFMDTIDAIILGRKTYELFIDYWPAADTGKEPIADKLNSTKKYICSRNLQDAPWGTWPAATILAGDAVEEIKKLKEQPGKNIVVWGSISLAQQLMKNDLIDEYRFRICPTAIGAGRPFFPEEKKPANFTLTDLVQYNSGMILLIYQPAGK